MSDEYAKPPYKRQTGIPAGCSWADMCDLKGTELEEKYKTILETLGEQGGTLGKIFKGATNKINNAAILYRIVQMIGRENWVSMSTDVKGKSTKACCRKTPRTSKAAPGNTSHPVR
jgi:type I restriction enzyme M protein